jgi:hypothetical protein
MAIQPPIILIVDDDLPTLSLLRRLRRQQPAWC